MAFLPPREELAEMMRVAEAFAGAGELVPRALRGDKGKIFAAMLFGSELGLSLMESLTELQIVDGKPSMSAGLIGARIRQAGHKVESEVSDLKATVTITRGDNGISHTAAFTIEEAQAAGLVRDGSGWKKYPSDMLYARALTRAGRRHVPDALKGINYTPEEVRALPVPEAPAALPATQNPPQSPAALLEAGSRGAESQNKAPEISPATQKPREQRTPLGLLPEGAELVSYVDRDKTLWKASLPTPLGDRILGPFPSEEEALQGVAHYLATGEVTVASASPQSQAAVAEAGVTSEPQGDVSSFAPPPPVTRSAAAPPPEGERRPRPAAVPGRSRRPAAEAAPVIPATPPPPQPTVAEAGPPPTGEDHSDLAAAIREAAGTVLMLGASKDIEDLDGAIDAALDKYCDRTFGFGFALTDDVQRKAVLEYLEARAEKLRTP